MKVVFVRGSGVAAWLIRMFTWSQWSHVAVQCGDKIIESTLLGGGVRAHPAVEWLAKTRVGYVADVYLPFPNVATEWVFDQVGKPYDWRALFAVLTRRRRWQDEGAWFCSELTAAALTAGGWPKSARLPHWRVTPQDLYLLV